MMRLGDLVAKLEKLDPEMEVMISTEYPVLIDGREWYALDPESVSVVNIVQRRDDDGFLHFTYEKGDLARPVAFISATPEM